MNNEKFIDCFLMNLYVFNEDYGNLSYIKNTKALYSYNIPIAQYYKNVILVNITFYSNKVNKHLNLLIELFKNYNKKVIFVKDVPEDVTNLAELPKENYLYL